MDGAAGLSGPARGFGDTRGCGALPVGGSPTHGLGEQVGIVRYSLPIGGQTIVQLSKSRMEGNVGKYGGLMLLVRMTRHNIVDNEAVSAVWLAVMMMRCWWLSQRGCLLVSSSQARRQEKWHVSLGIRGLGPHGCCGRSKASPSPRLMQFRLTTPSHARQRKGGRAVEPKGCQWTRQPWLLMCMTRYVHLARLCLGDPFSITVTGCSRAWARAVPKDQSELSDRKYSYKEVRKRFHTYAY